MTKPETQPRNCKVLCHRDCCNKPHSPEQKYYPYCLRYPDVSKWMVENEHENMQYSYDGRVKPIDCFYYNRPKPEE